MRLLLAAAFATAALGLAIPHTAEAQTRVIVKKRAAPQSYLSTARTGQPQSPNAQRVSVHSSNPLYGTLYGGTGPEARGPLPGPFDLPGRW